MNAHWKPNPAPKGLEAATKGQDDKSDEDGELLAAGTAGTASDKDGGQLQIYWIHTSESADFRYLQIYCIHTSESGM